jgi:hypothetical protein
MRVHHCALAVITTAGLVACGSETRRASDDAAGVATIEMAAAREAVLQNEYVELFTLTLEPGQAIAPHEGAARVIYSLSDYTIRYTEGADSRETSALTGDAHVHASGTHAIANIGTTTARLLVVARSGAALPGGENAQAQAPAPAAAAEPTAFLVDDDQFRVTVVTLAAGGVLPKHAGLARVVYALSDYTIRYEADGAAAADKTFRTGEAHWHDADSHAITNTGTTEARFLMVQFKR